jgi:hypothetical protein
MNCNRAPSNKRTIKSSLPASAALLAMVALTAIPVRAAVTNLAWRAEASVKETYDSNVYLQDNAPTAANVAAAQAAGLTRLESGVGELSLGS